MAPKCSREGEDPARPHCNEVLAVGVLKGSDLSVAGAVHRAALLDAEPLEPFDDFEIRIYTISGRLIRSIREDINLNPVNVPHGACRTGYNELIWDGTDTDGNQVANGVYFAMLRAKYQGKVKEKILKVARLR